MQTIESSSGAAERRQNPRTKLVEIAYIGMGPENGGLVLDVSDGGLSFHSVAPIQREEKVQFLLSLRGHSRIEGTGQVVWTNQIGTVCGLKFTSLSPGALEHLNNWKAQSNTSAPPRAKSVFQAPPVIVAAPVAVKSSVLNSILKIESPEPVFAIPPAAEDDRSVQITEVRGQSPLFWIATGAVVAAFASVAFFYGVRVGRAYYTGPVTAVQNADTNSKPGALADLPVPPAQNGADSRVAPATATTATQSAASPAPPTLVNASRIQGISGDAPKVSEAARPVPPVVPSSIAALSSSPAATKTSAEEAKPSQVSAPAPRLSPDDGIFEYSAAMADLNGDNGKRDTAAAVNLLQIASKKGNTLAEVTLADLYVFGDGVPQDCAKGKSLLTEASKRGNVQAKVRLDELNAEGCP